MGRLVVGVNDLATKRPDLVPELVDPSVATSVTWRSNTPVEWRCQNGHVWTALVANRTAKKGTNCPYCFGRYPIVGETDLATTRPDLAAELLDPALATALTTSSNKKIKWRCQLGHEWTASPNSRSSGSACPVCAGRVVLPGFNDSGAHLINLAFFDGNLLTLQLAQRRSLEQVARAVRRLTREPAEFFGVDAGRLDVGAQADIVLIDPDALRGYDTDANRRMVYREIFAHEQLVNRSDGVVTGVFIAGEQVWDGRDFMPALGARKLGRPLTAGPAAAGRAVA